MHNRLWPIDPVGCRTSEIGFAVISVVHRLTSSIAQDFNQLHIRWTVSLNSLALDLDHDIDHVRQPIPLNTNWNGLFWWSQNMDEKHIVIF